jgi:hypothetical protein
MPPMIHGEMPVLRMRKAGRRKQSQRPSFLLHTQEDLAPRNLLDNTVRCLMPFLARGHPSPDEGGEDGGSAPGWLWGEFWIQILSSGPTADPARESVDRPRPLEPGGPVQLDRLPEVPRHPAGCVEAHRRGADQFCQVRL